MVSGGEKAEHVIDEFLKDGGVDLVRDGVAVARGEHELRVAENAEVSRDGGPRDGEPLGDGARRHRSVAEQGEDRSPRGVGEGAKDGVGSRHCGGRWRREVMGYLYDKLIS